MLRGQVALVTGASGPIGTAIVQALQGAGAKVAAQYSRNLPEHGTAIQADLRKAGFEIGLLESVTNTLGAPSILVNCAADQAMGAMAGVSDDELRDLMRINVEAVISLSREFAAQTPDKPASIVNISSIEAQIPLETHGHYAASKAALESLTKSFAVEFAPQVRTNAVAPGLIARANIETQWPEGVARWNAACPLNRMGTPNDVANAVLFLASPAAAWINGSILTLDGGVTAKGGW